MVVTIDKAGRIIIPKELREDLDFSPQTELEIIRDRWEIRIRKKEAPSIQIEKRSGFSIVDFISDKDDSKVLKEIREERISFK